MTVWLCIAIAALVGALVYQVRLTRRAVGNERRIHSQLAELHDRLDQQAGEITERTGELEALGDSLAHDLRNPLNTIALNLHLMRAALGGADAHREAMALDHMERAKDQMVGILDTLRRYSRVCFAELVEESVDMTALARRVCEGLAVQPSSAALDWQVESLPSCQADPALVRTLLLNLLDHAPSHSPGDRPREVRIGHEPGSRPTVYVVRDSAMADAGAEPLRRHGARSFVHAGGLMVAARVASRHGGRLWLAPPGGTEGATVRFRLGPEEAAAGLPAVRAERAVEK